MARRVGDPGALMVALSHAAWTRGSRPLDEILADLTEAGELARTLPHDYLSDVVRGMRIALLIEAFAIDEARADNAALRELSERAGQPFLARVVEQHEALLALCDGRLDAAEAAANRSDEIAREIEEAHSAVHGIQMFSIRREQGRLAEIAPRGPPHRVGADGGRQRLAAGARRAARRDRRRRVGAPRARGARRRRTSGPSFGVDSVSAG